MREASLILPERDNAGASLAAVHEALQDRLCQAWGGFTVSYAKSGRTYNNGLLSRSGLLTREDVRVYTVVVGEHEAPALLTIARDLRRVARQEAIYLQLSDGSVVFVGD